MAPRKLAKTAPAEEEAPTRARRVTRSAAKPTATTTTTPAATKPVETGQRKTRVAKTATKKAEAVASGDEQANNDAGQPVAANEQPVSKARGTRKKAATVATTAAAAAPTNSTVAISTTEGEPENVEQPQPSSSRARKGRAPATAAAVEAQPETVKGVEKKPAIRKRKVATEKAPTPAQSEPAPEPAKSTQKRTTSATTNKTAKTPAVAAAAPVETKPTRGKRGAAASAVNTTAGSTTEKTTKPKATTTRSTRATTPEVKATESSTKITSKSRKTLEPVFEAEAEASTSAPKKIRGRNLKQETVEPEKIEEKESAPVEETKEVPQASKPRQRERKMATGKTITAKEEGAKLPARRGRPPKETVKTEPEAVAENKDVAEDIPDGSQLVDHKTGERHPAFKPLDAEPAVVQVKEEPTSSAIKAPQPIVEEVKVEQPKVVAEIKSESLELEEVDSAAAAVVEAVEQQAMEVCEVKSEIVATDTTDNTQQQGQKRKLHVVQFPIDEIEPAKKARIELPEPIGDLFTFGEPMAGELGPRMFTHNGRKARKTELGLVKLQSKVRQVAVGAYHTVVLTQLGKVITFGVNDDLALGRHIGKASKSNGNHASETMEESLNGGEDSIDETIDSEDEDEYEERMAGKPLPVEGLEHKVIKVTAGDMHSGALCENGDVYIWGNMK